MFVPTRVCFPDLQALTKLIPLLHKFSPKLPLEILVVSSILNSILASSFCHLQIIIYIAG